MAPAGWLEQVQAVEMEGQAPPLPAVRKTIPTSPALRLLGGSSYCSDLHLSDISCHWNQQKNCKRRNVEKWTVVLDIDLAI